MLVASNSGRLDAISFSEVAGSIKPGDALALAGENGFTCDGLNDFDFSPMARALVIACGEGVIRLSENSSGVSGRPLSAWSRTAIDGLEDVTAVAAHPSRNIFATVDSDCNFSIIRGESIEPVRFSIFPQYCGSGVAGLAFAPEGDRLIAASRDQVCVLSFNDESLSLLRCSPFHTALVQLGDPTFIRDPQSGQIRLMIGGGAWPISAHWTNNLETNTSQDLDLHALAEEPMKWGLTSADLGLSFNGTGLVAGTNGGSLVILRAAGESWSVYSSMRSELLSISAVMTAPVGRMYASDCIQRGERDSNEFLAYATQSGNIYTALVLAPESKQCF